MLGSGRSVVILGAAVLAAAASAQPARAGNEVFDARGLKQGRPTSNPLPFEHIDPLNGNLLLVFTDLSLPGNAGFDLNIQRTYNSKIFRDEGFGAIDWDSWAGVGWSMHMGRVRTKQDDSPLAVEMPDGSAHKLFGNFVGDSGQFVTRDYWLYDRNTSPPTLKLTNGVVFTFDKVVTFPSGNCYRYPTRIEDPFGNRIDIVYGTVTQPPDAIQKITQYLGPPGNAGSQKREITFTTETVNGRMRLKEMIFLGRKWTYKSTASSDASLSLLTEVQPPGDPAPAAQPLPWKFSYSTSGVRDELLQLTTPNGGTITWTYGTQGAAASGVLKDPFYLGSTVSVTARVVTTRVSGGRDPSAGTRTYWYAQGAAAHNQTIVTEPSSCSGSAGGSTTEYTFLGVGDDYANGSVWKVGLLAKRQTKEGTTVLETEDLTWRAPGTDGWDNISPITEQVGPNTDYGIYAPVVASRTITRGGQTYVTTNGYHSEAYRVSGPNFNDYGRPWQVVDVGDAGTRTTEHTFAYGFTPFVKDRVATETVTVGTESFKRSWAYSIASGFLTDEYGWGSTATNGIHLKYAKDAMGNVASVTDANSHKTSYTHDWGVRRNVQTPAYPGVDTIGREINPDGSIKSETRRLDENDGAGYKTSYTYDLLMRTKKIAPSVGEDTSFDYDDGNTSGSSFVKHTRGTSFLRTDLDGFGRTSGSIDAVDVQTDVSYDACDRKSYESLPFDPKHAQDTTGFAYKYDALGRPTSRTNPGTPPSSVAYRYSGTGLTGIDVEITDEESRKTLQKWTAFGQPSEARLAEVTLDSGDSLAQITTKYTYNALGSLTGVSGDGSQSRTFTYTAKNQLETEVHPERGTTSYTYDEAGNLETVTDALGTLTKYGHDENGRLVCVDEPPYASPLCSTPSADDVRVGYDRADNRTSLENASVASTFEFDGANRLTKRTDSVAGPGGSVPFVTSYSHDGRDNLDLLTYPAPSTTAVKYTYDSGNRITDVRQNAATSPWASGFTYHPSGAPELLTTGNALATKTTYTGRHWVDTLKVGVTADPLRVLSLEYGYDKVGNPTSIAENTTGRTGMSVGTLAYDHLDRLITAPGPWGAGSYGMNALGDRTTKTIAGATTKYTYDATTGRLATLSGAETDSFSYDNVGNLLSEAGTMFTYTLRNTLKTATVGGGVTTYGYDGDDARAFKIGPAGPASIRYYVHGPGGLLLSEYAACGAGVERVRDYVYAGARLLAVVREAPTAAFAITASAVLEGLGAQATVEVTLTTASGCPATAEVSVAYATVNGTALAGLDYTATSGILRFPEGSLSGTVQTIQVPLVDDAAPEVAETFQVTLTAYSGAVIGGAPHTVTIQDDDIPSFSFATASSSVSEKGSWMTSQPGVKFVTKDGTRWMGADVSVNYTTLNGTAVAGGDYQAKSGTITFQGSPIGTPSGTVRPIVPVIIPDGVPEGDESFSLVLSNPVGGRIDTPSTHLVTIADDDVLGTKTASGVLEPGGSVVYTITLRRPGTGVPGTAQTELTDTLPPQLTLTQATASSGSVTSSGNTATWTGAVAPLGSVSVTLEASITSATAGQQVSNQGTVRFDGNGDGVVEVQALTDDPGQPGAADPTIFQVGTGAVSFYTLTPCRIVDTRNPTGPLGGPALTGQGDRAFTLRGACGIPSTAKALAVNLTVTGATQTGHLRFHPPGLLGNTSAVNYAAGQTRANNAMVALDVQGRVAVFCGQPTASTADLILDINGYFE